MSSQEFFHLRFFNMKYRLFFLRSITQFFTQIYMSWTNLGHSGKFMDNCWISCQIMADMKNVYDDLIIVNLYVLISYCMYVFLTQVTSLFLSFAYRLISMRSLQTFFISAITWHDIQKLSINLPEFTQFVQLMNWQNNSSRFV